MVEAIEDKRDVAGVTEAKLFLDNVLILMGLGPCANIDEARKKVHDECIHNKAI